MLVNMTGYECGSRDLTSHPPSHHSQSSLMVNEAHVVNEISNDKFEARSDEPCRSYISIVRQVIRECLLTSRKSIIIVLAQNVVNFPRIDGQKCEDSTAFTSDKFQFPRSHFCKTENSSSPVFNCSAYLR